MSIESGSLCNRCKMSGRSECEFHRIVKSPSTKNQRAAEAEKYKPIFEAKGCTRVERVMGMYKKGNKIPLIHNTFPRQRRNDSADVVKDDRRDYGLRAYWESYYKKFPDVYDTYDIIGYIGFLADIRTEFPKKIPNDLYEDCIDSLWRIIGGIDEVMRAEVVSKYFMVLMSWKNRKVTGELREITDKGDFEVLFSQFEN